MPVPRFLVRSRQPILAHLADRYLQTNLLYPRSSLDTVLLILRTTGGLASPLSLAMREFSHSIALSLDTHSFGFSLASSRGHTLTSPL